MLVPSSTVNLLCLCLTDQYTPKRKDSYLHPFQLQRAHSFLECATRMVRDMEHMVFEEMWRKISLFSLMKING